jgi:hypothetical protein
VPSRASDFHLQLGDATLDVGFGAAWFLNGAFRVGSRAFAQFARQFEGIFNLGSVPLKGFTPRLSIHAIAFPADGARS